MKSRYAIPLIFAVVSLMFLFVVNIDEELKETLDPYMLLFVGLTFTGCMVITLGFTRLWTLRSAGVLLTLAGDSALYTSAGFRSVGGFYLIPATVAVDITRSCFYLGGPLLLVGLIQYGWKAWKGRRPSPEPLDTTITTGLP